MANRTVQVKSPRTAHAPGIVPGRAAVLQFLPRTEAVPYPTGTAPRSPDPLVQGHTMIAICKHRLGACLIALLLSGCAGKPVDVVQPAQFKNMADRMSKELIARNLLDNARNYVAPLTPSFNAPDYGAALFTRLSPAFLFEDRVQAAPAASFAAGVRPGDRVQRRGNGFTIHTLNKKISVNMIAVADWDNDGRDDWIVSCLVEPANGGRTRDYYVVIPAPAASGPLQGTAVAVYECFGLACTLYMRETKIPEVPASDGTAKTTVIETVPGLKPVTLPPGAPAPAEEDGLIEKNLD